MGFNRRAGDGDDIGDHDFRQHVSRHFQRHRGSRQRSERQEFAHHAMLRIVLSAAIVLRRVIFADAVPARVPSLRVLVVLIVVMMVAMPGAVVLGRLGQFPVGTMAGAIMTTVAMLVP